MALFSSAAAWPLAGHAQQRAMPVIGILHSQTQSSETARMAAIEQGLKEVGFVIGRNLTIEQRFAEGHNDRLPKLAGELARMQVNVIFANTTPPAIAAKAATATIPIVFVTGVDPVEVGLVAGFNRPGANVTGVTFLSNKLVAKRLELLINLVPETAPIGMLAAQHNPNTETDVRDALAAAKALGRKLYVVEVPPQGDIDVAVVTLVHQRVGALFVAPQADFRMWRDQLLAQAMRHALPTSFSSSDHVTAGGLMSYGPDQSDSYREAAIYAGRILKGEKPADLPVLIATKFEFVINLKTAKTLGMTVPPSLLASATELIE
jgi:putative ABC transport system substrate-binding protein